MHLKLLAIDGSQTIVLDVIEAEFLLDALIKLHVKLNDVGSPRSIQKERTTADKIFRTHTDNEPIISC